MKFIRLAQFEELLIVSDNGNEFLVCEDCKGFLRTEKQPREIWKRKRPRWPKKSELQEVR